MGKFYGLGHNHHFINVSFDRWKSAFFNQGSSKPHALFVVQIEHGDGGSAAWRIADNVRAAPAEMIAPHILSWMRQPDDSLRERIDSGKIRQDSV
jgi:hypothetical protein